MSRTYTLHSTPAADAPDIDFKASLNAAQYEAVSSPPGQALVIAGAGSGKTRTLTYRVAWLLQNGIAAENILLLTFTNKAAREMMERVNALVPGQAGGLWSGTFHSIGNRILRRHADSIGFTKQFSILDSDDQKSMMTKVIDESGEAKLAGGSAKGRGKKKEDGFPKAQVISGMISLATNTCESLATVIEQRYPYFEEYSAGLKKVAALYQSKKQKANSMDFDDLLALTVELLSDNDAVRKHYQRQFQFILVDEYQDTNALQSEMIDLLAGEHGNIMVVGDDAQSIYSWRGADFENILRFLEKYPKGKKYVIETNYRSVPEVLELANEAIANNVRQFKKNLVAARPSQQMKPALIEVNTPSQQAQFVSQRMRELHEQEGIEYSQMAVLYRAHFQSMEVQMQLTQDRVPFVITSGLRFFEQQHVKDVCAFLKWAANPLDEVSFDRLIRLLPGVGPGAAAKIWLEWIATPASRLEQPPASYSMILGAFKKVPTRAAGAWEQVGHIFDEFLDGTGAFHPPAALLTSIIEGIYDDYARSEFDNYDSRKQDLDQLRNFSERFTDLNEMLADLALLTNADDSSPKDRKPKPGEDAAVLTSIHQAKGLEWKVVFIIWLAQGMFPNKRVIDEGGPEALEEERRLFYVAVTRAMDQLHLLWPRFWPKAYSGDTFQEPSQFLGEFDPERVEEWNIGGF